MKTEYILSDAQKAEISRLSEMIIDLNAQIAAIYLKSRVRYITETEEECKMVQKYFYEINKPLQGIVKINTEIKDIESINGDQ